MNPKHVRFTSEAEARLAKVPFFIRPFVKRRAQEAAAARGLSEVTAELLTELKSKEHLGS